MAPATGRVIWQGKTDHLALTPREMLAYRRDIQMVFQDPLAGLNPRMTAGQIIAEPLKTHFPVMPSPEVKARVQLMMDRVGLLPNQINRYPHEFSGGQCQRIGIAHDLCVVKHVSDRVMVMYLGRTMEDAPRRSLFTAPQHPCTQALLSAVPILDPVAERRKVMIPLDGDPLSPLSPPSGCVFRTRCFRPQPGCTTEIPALIADTACQFPGLLAQTG